ncbi:unnamed protein product, partial [Mesorhabditis spiculigera]
MSKCSYLCAPCVFDAPDQSINGVKSAINKTCTPYEVNYQYVVSNEGDGTTPSSYLNLFLGVHCPAIGCWAMQTQEAMSFAQKVLQGSGLGDSPFFTGITYNITSRAFANGCAATASYQDFLGDVASAVTGPDWELYCHYITGTTSQFTNCQEVEFASSGPVNLFGKICQPPGMANFLRALLFFCTSAVFAAQEHPRAIRSATILVDDTSNVIKDFINGVHPGLLVIVGLLIFAGCGFELAYGSRGSSGRQVTHVASRNNIKNAKDFQMA